MQSGCLYPCKPIFFWHTWRIPACTLGTSSNDKWMMNMMNYLW
jgi:hypothetical protein